MAAVERFRILALTFCVVTGIAMLCASEEVTLVISKQYYAVGETVYFTVTNGLADSIAFIHDPIYEVRDSTGTEIFPVTHGEWLVYFEPGHSETLFWRQQYPMDHTNERGRARDWSLLGTDQGSLQVSRPAPLSLGSGLEMHNHRGLVCLARVDSHNPPPTPDPAIRHPLWLQADAS